MRLQIVVAFTDHTCVDNFDLYRRGNSTHVLLCSLLPKNIFFNAERTMHLVSRPRDHHRLLGVARCVCRNDVSAVVFIGHASNSLCKFKNMFKEQKKKKSSVDLAMIQLI